MAIDRSLSLLVKFAALDRLTGPMKAMSAGARGAGKSIGETRRELAQLERAQARIGKMKALETRLRADGAALDQARAKVAELAAAIEGAETPTKKMTAALAKAERDLARLEGRCETGGAELQQLTRKLEAAGIDVADLGRHETRLADDLDRTNRKLKEQQAELAKGAAARARFARTQQLGSNIRGAGYGALGAGVAIGAPIAGTTDNFQDFQSGLTQIGLKAEMSRAKTRLLGAEILALGPKVSQLPQNLLTGVDDLLGKGLDPARAMQMIKPIGMAATAYQADIADLSSAAYAGLDNLKVAAKDTNRQLDIMATAGKRGSFEMKDMANSFPALTAAAQSLGQKGLPAVADLAAALQIARKGAGSSDEAANNILNLMNKINSKEAVENFSKFGVDLPAAMKKAAAEGKAPMEAIAELTSGVLAKNPGKLSYLFGDAQVQAALRPLMANLKLYREIRADALKAQGTVERDFAYASEDDANKAARSGAQLSALAVKIGSVVSPQFVALKALVGDTAASFTAWADQHPRLASGLITIVAGLAGLLVVCGAAAIAGGTLVTAFGYMVKTFKFIAIGLKIVAVAFRFLTGAMMTNPFIALAVGIGVAGYLIYSHWDKIKAAFTGAWTWLKSLDFASIGKNMLIGLLNGLSPFLLVRHILKLGGKAITALKGVLGIRSPSRVFAGIGGMMTEGLAVGINRGAGAPIARMKSVAKGMAIAGIVGASPIAATVPKLAAGSAAPGSAPTAVTREYHLHLNMPAGAAADPAGFARAVLEEIRKLEGAERRSAYEDDA